MKSYTIPYLIGLATVFILTGLFNYGNVTMGGIPISTTDRMVLLVGMIILFCMFASSWVGEGSK